MKTQRTASACHRIFRPIPVLLILASILSGCGQRAAVEQGVNASPLIWHKGKAYLYEVNLTSEIRIGENSGATDLKFHGTLSVVPLKIASDKSAAVDTELLIQVEQLTVSSSEPESNQLYQSLSGEFKQPFVCKYTTGRNSTIQMANSAAIPVTSVIRTLCASETESSAQLLSVTCVVNFKPKSRMWEIHNSGSVRGIDTPHLSENLKRSYICLLDRKKL